jgi:ADP-heptose:LPS heptosyltransferase
MQFMEIVLLRLDRIGDFILGIPSYRALRQAYPNDHISVVVPSFVAELAKACPYFDEVYVFEALWLFPKQPLMHRWKSAWKLVRFLRSKKIDLIFDFRYQNRLDPLVTGLSGADQRVGYDLGWVSRFLTLKVSIPQNETHQIDRNLQLLQEFGVTTADKKLELWFHEKDRKSAQNRMPAQTFLPNVPVVAVHIGASTPSKRWGTESFATLLYEIHAQTQAELYVLGDEQDLPMVHEVLDGLRCPVVNLVGKFSLLETAAFLKDCDLFIGCDSGITHLAASAGLPVICLFSAANEVDVWKPVGPKVKVLTHHPECSPCRRHDCTRTDGYFCMDEIKVENALEEVKTFLTPRKKKV